MKRYFLRILTIIMVVNIAFDAKGQSSFDTKKKNSDPANVSSFNAITIKGSSNTASQGNHPYQTAINRLAAIKTIQQKSNSADGDLVIRSKETNLPIFIQFDVTKTLTQKSTLPGISDQTFAFLNQLKSKLDIESPVEYFSIKRVNEDQNRKTHVRLNQVYKGIEVFGAEIIVHLNEAGFGEVFNGRYHIIENDIDIIPLITELDALNNTIKHLHNQNRIIVDFADEGLLSVMETPVYELCIYKPSNELSDYSLVYHLTVFTADHHRWEYFIDAQNGQVIDFYENTCYADGARTASANDLNGINRSVNTYQIGSNYYLLDASRAMYNAAGSQLPDNAAGAILTLDMNNTYGNNQSFIYVVSDNNAWNKPTAVSAHFNSGIAYEYFRQKHNRNSIDGNGGNIISIINVPDIETGFPMDNAFWNGRFMCYGNGDVAFMPLAGSIDVAGHEMTHGVVENTASLIYEGESGAINESMADIFGAMMDGEDWLIGEDVVKSAYFPSGALRSLSDPHNGGNSLNDPGYQPRHMNEKYQGSEDNSGVHINSGIPNYAFYLYATAVGKDKAAAIFYRALDLYLTKSSQFIDLRLGVIQSATDIYGAGSNEVSQAITAFNTVGITDGQSNNNNPTLPENPGDEYVLVYNTDAGDANTLYRSDISMTVVEPLTTTGFMSRPSVTDDGSVAIFVAEDNTLHAIITSPDSEPTEFTLQEEPIWSNAVVSKDGNRIAAVTAYIDTAIYIYDFVSELWAKFTLYTPTYTEGINSAGPIYADALEFDYSGEFLVYDAFNSLENNSGANIEYWDVNFIRVWDMTAENFGDGTIFKLFSSIPENVSIGNPAFSKNSTNIIAFDYLGSDPEEYYVLGCNIETNDVNIIIENNTIGWPSFNKDDSRLAYSSEDFSGDLQIDYVQLNSDKISSDGNVFGMFTQAKWPVYFSTGERVISSVKKDMPVTSEIKFYPNPFTDEVTIQLPVEFSGDITMEVMSLSGQRVFSTSEYYSGNDNITVLLDHLKPGYYLVKVIDGNHIGLGKLLKVE